MGFLLAGFVFWRRGKEEHYSEIQLMDGFLLSFLVGVLGARIGFVIFQWERFGLHPFAWLDFFGRPGLQGVFFLVFATSFLKSFAKKKKWDVYEVLDFWSLSLVAWTAMTSFGQFLTGIGAGKFTDSSLGVVLAGSIQKTHPVQLYSVVLLSLLYWYLSWSESRYRTFEWYRLGKKAAQTGFMLSNFWIFYALISAFLLFFRLPEFILFGRAFDGWIYGFMLLVGVRTLLGRSDKPLLPESFKAKFSFRRKKIDEQEI